MKKILKFSSANLVFLSIVILFFLFDIEKDKKEIEPPNKEPVKLIEVLDGDTLKVKSYKNNQVFKVRLIGIDTPESNLNPKLKRELQKSTKTEKEIIKMGIISKQFTQKMVESSRFLYLEYDIQLYDKYNRKLAYVYLENGKMLNYLLVREGYAKVYTFPPNVKYQEKFLEAQKLAQKEKKGLWKGSE